MSGEPELVMPFVTVVSKGGPHDDESYTAGWEMGQLDGRLGAARFHGLGLPQLWIKRASLAQADLIAMKNGAAMREQSWDDLPTGESITDEVREQWASVSFKWIEP